MYSERVSGVCKQIKLAASRIESLYSTADGINRFETPNDLITEPDESLTETIGMLMSQAVDELGHLQELVFALTGALMPATADEDSDSDEHTDEDEGSVFAEGDLTDKVLSPDADKGTGKQD